MRHEYYYYSREQLLAAPKLPITVMADNAAVFQTMAREMADEIRRKNALGEKTVFICPVGPVGQYPYFVEMVNSEDISLKNVWFLNMDEYLTDEKEWIGKDHRLSFRGFMDRTVYTKIRPDLVMPESQRVFPDPKDPENMWRTIQALGGVDICFLRTAGSDSLRAGECRGCGGWDEAGAGNRACADYKLCIRRTEAL